MDANRTTYLSALDDFDRLHRRAAFDQLWSGILGQRSAELLSYEDVSRQLKVTSQSSSGVQDIPLDAIVGSVGRYHDFTRNFLPKKSQARSVGRACAPSRGNGRLAPHSGLPGG